MTGSFEVVIDLDANARSHHVDTTRALPLPTEAIIKPQGYNWELGMWKRCGGTEVLSAFEL